MKLWFPLLFVAQAAVLGGCARPSSVNKIQSTRAGLYLTVETFNGNGPVASDFTRVFANLDLYGDTTKQLVVDGEYLEISKVVWPEPGALTICINSGITNSFHNEVTLILGESSQTIHSILNEHC